MDGCAYMFKGQLYTNAINYMRWPNFHTCVGSGHFLCVCVGGGGGGGGGVKNLNFNILGGFQKMNIFGGMKICGYFFGEHHKIGLY